MHPVLDEVEWVGQVHQSQGRKPVIAPDQIDKMIADTANTTPPDATHWSNRTMALWHVLPLGKLSGLC